jgi:ATP-dependent DNA helicase RecG
MFDLTQLIGILRYEGGDLPGVEVKAAGGGLPESIIPTLCSFANRPGGGTIVLGLDEAAGFAPVGLVDLRAMKEALASKARQALEPPIVVDIDEGSVDGVPIIVCVVHELDPSQKPCRVAGGTHRGVWVRAWDGDYRASDPEIQGLLANRTQPRFDAEPAPNATRADLDPDLVADFIRNCRSGSGQLASISEDDELLWRMGVTVGMDRVPSVAGLLALGVYPQQYLPATGLQAVLIAGRSDPANVRALDARRFDGPISQMIVDATSWVTRSSPSAIVSDPATGQVTNRDAWPADAVRELIGNALIHRDLAPWALSETALVRLDGERLVVKNPGGLYGVDVNRLGQVGVTSARNANLARICQYVRLPGGTRAAEALASGIPTVLNAVKSAGLPPPIFGDDGLRFTVVLRQRTLHAAPSVKPRSSRSRLLIALGVGPLDVRQLQAATGLAPPNIRKQLRLLRDEGLVRQHGGQGQPTTYSRTSLS